MVTVGSYLSNPYGRGVAAFSSSHAREQVQGELQKDYPAPITYEIYGSKKTDIIIHCHMPSRTKKDISYDVVFQINISMANDDTKQGIGHYPFKCFSNSPSFYYTFAKAFRAQDMICDWLWRKYDRKVRRRDSEVRNPSRIVGYERTIYTCLWFIYQQLRGQNVRDIYKNAIAKSFHDIAKLVKSQDELEDAYAKAPYSDAYMRRKQEEAAKRQARELARKQEREAKAAQKAAHNSSSTKTAKTSTTSKISKTSSRTKTSSKTKKI